MNKVADFGCSRLNKVIHGVFQCGLWAIRKWWNKLDHASLDDQYKVIEEDIFLSIQRLTMIWISARSKMPACINGVAGFRILDLYWLPKSKKEGNFSSINYETCNWVVRGTKSSSGHVMTSFCSKSMGAFRFQSLVSNAKQLIKLNSKHHRDVPKGYLAVYVGEVQRKRFVVPLSYLDQPLFQELLRRSEEDFGFNHPMGGLTIPCREEAFVHLTNQLHIS
ncbi:small auxin-up RNA [Artemisia annua]|uniref:Small auxin-up RNA n=1 Tax=Artemisia annua TaxID=35608 RepID=A0A2U1LBI2_ARTAN|nr:small auxin-up RNA [Artemisia annua]